MESMRSASGLPSSLVSYFANDSINKHQGLSVCMDAIAEKVDMIDPHAKVVLILGAGYPRMRHGFEYASRRASSSRGTFAGIAFTVDLQCTSHRESARCWAKVSESPNHVVPFVDV
jgi:hypothetical protein